ncbi:MAG: hypothetical protein ACFB0F_05325 [Neomegalonema sp.]
MNKLMLVGVIVAGALAGGAVGFVMMPEPPELTEEEKKKAQEEAKKKAKAEKMAKKATEYDYLRLDRQFVVPIIEDGSVRSLVVLELNLEIEPGASERIYSIEPRVRDALLAQLHRTAQEGGFVDRLGTSSFLNELREDLRLALKPILGDDLHSDLIGNNVRRAV